MLIPLIICLTAFLVGLCMLASYYDWVAHVGSIAILGGFLGSLFCASCLIWPGWNESDTHWVGPEVLAERVCADHGKVHDTSGDTVGRGATNGWMITCKDGEVFHIPDGKEEDN